MNDPDGGDGMTTTAPDRLTRDELRTLFLFEALSDSQLDRLADRGRVEEHGAGSTIFTEGEPATCFYVLLSGTVTLSRKIHGDEVELTRTEQRGVYAGAWHAFLGDLVEQVYP